MQIRVGTVLVATWLASCGPVSVAQTEATARQTPAMTAETFYLTNTARQEDANEIVVALRNILSPENKVFLVYSQNAIVMSGTPEQLASARKILSELDRPKRVYRLTYTLTEMDGSTRVGTQHLAMIVAGGQRTTLKQGSKIPVATGSYTAGSNGSQNQFTYLDIGLNFDATLDEFVNGVRLRTKVEQSSAPPEGRSAAYPDDPVIRQTVLEGTSFLSVGKPLILGSLDIAGSTRHLDIAVTMDIVPQ